MDDLLSEFLTETFENIDVVDVELVKLEQDPNNKEVLANIFRLVHTIKGTCGFLGLPRLEAVAHASENVLGKFRDGVIEVNADCVTLILESLDQIKVLLAHLEQNEAEPDGEDKDLIDRLNVAAEGGLSGGAAAGVPEVAELEVPAVATEPAKEVRPGEVSEEELEAAFLAAEGPDDVDVPSSDEMESSSATEIEEQAQVEQATSAEEVKAPDQSGAPAAGGQSSIANQSIRVNVDVLENLMTMVSELVLTRNQLLQMLRSQENSEFKVPLQRLSGVTSDLQEAVMKTRMQPIGSAWQKLPRIVRDLSNELGKKIDLVMTGADTELDRQVLELIKDPLTHIVRNSADHGLEMPDVRKAAGKSPTGKVELKAYHEGGHIIIEIVDDGKGLPTKVISDKAIQKGLVTEADIANMSEPQIQKFIFHPGFSTAAKVTNVSGRGVGMDVVRTNIEVIGGSIDLKSTEGKGTTLTIKIPLTLAIVSALIVKVAGQKYAVPQLSVVELVRTKPGSGYVIEKISDTPVLRLRDRLLPLVYLSDLLGVRAPEVDMGELKTVEEVEDDATTDNAGIVATVSGDDFQAATQKVDEDFIIVSQVGSQTFGVVVDGVYDTEEIVVKPVASILRDISLFSGNTILGDGSVIMILDPIGLAANVDSLGTEAAEAKEEEEASAAADNDDTMSLLVFKAGSDEPKAVPLSLVTRLEELDVETIEYANGANVVQYRGVLMPVITVSPHQTLKTEGRQPILVFSDEDRSIGLAVDEIVDIVEEALQIELGSDNPGQMGTAIIREKATEVIDVSYFLTQGFGDWFTTTEKESGKLNKRILLVEDSAFFRNLITPLLATSGYDVVTVGSVDEALKLKEADHAFDLIVSDIEMPGTDGWEFAAKLQEDEKWGKTPIVALSSRNSITDVEKSREAGFFDHVSKSDRDRLLSILGEAIDVEEDAA